MSEIKSGDLVKAYRWLVYSQREGESEPSLNLDNAKPEALLPLLDQLAAVTNAVIARAESARPPTLGKHSDWQWLMMRADIMASCEIYLQKLDMMRRVCLAAQEDSGPGLSTRSVNECVVMPLMLGWYPKIGIADDGSLICEGTSVDGQVRYTDPDQKTQSTPLIERPIQLRDMLTALQTDPRGSVDNLILDLQQSAAELYENTKDIAAASYDKAMDAIEEVMERSARVAGRAARKAALPASLALGVAGGLALIWLMRKA